MGNDYELWSVDEYGQSAIINRSESISTLLDLARKEVQNVNVENALTAAEKQKNWEAYFVEVMDGDGMSDNHFYAGNRPDGKHRVLDVSSNSSLEELTASHKIRLYLGNLDGKEWYASDLKGNEVSNLSDQILEDKTVFFIRPVK